MKKMFVLMIFVTLCVYASSVIGNTNNNTCVVKFDFDGLQAIAFGDSSRVSDGILDVPHHVPNIDVKRVENGKETTLYTIKADELKGKVLNVSIANGKEVAPIRHYSGDMSKDTTDFRWCLDIENDLFQKQLYLKDDKFFCRVHFLTGEFLTDHISEDKYQFVTNTTIHPFKRQIGAPTNRLELRKGNNLIINGLDKEIKLPYQIGASYTVNITNLPPKDMMNMDHFGFYYSIVKADIPKFMPVVVQKAAFMPRPFLCGAIVLGKSKIN